jgi:hypothetical protein
MEGVNLTSSSKIINKMYDNLTYYDLYGSSMFVFFIVTLIVVLTVLYCKAMNDSQEIKDDWNNRRCDPSVIPFAGVINAPEGTSATDFTSENFSYCVQNIIKDSSEEALRPLTIVTDMITDLFVTLQNAVNAIRGAFSKLRQRFADVVAQIMGRILSIMTPIQVMFITFSDIMQKTQAVMASALYTVLGIYYALQAGTGAAVEGIIKILLIMVGIIAALWILPFTMPAAAISTAIFLTISIPTAIITAIVSKALKIQSSGIPGLCFDEDTMIKMCDGSQVKIRDIQLGDILENDNTVTGTMRLLTNGVNEVNSKKETMYNLNGVIVSGSHVVKFAGNWIKVREHPYAALIKEYSKPFLHCMNTSNKTIVIEGTTFTDWDELYGESLDKMSNMVKHVFEKIDGGFSKDTRVELKEGRRCLIKDVIPGDILKDGETVLGTVKVRLLPKTLLLNYCLGDSIMFTGTNINVLEDNFYTIKKKNSQFNSSLKEETMYHLITDVGEFNVMGVRVYDYNSLVDKYLKNGESKYKIMK